jgi:hypothetical protein
MYGNRQLELELQVILYTVYAAVSSAVLLKRIIDMKKLKLFTVIVMLAGVAGCLSIDTSKSGPPGPKGDPGTSSEKVIVVPDKDY